MTLGFRYRTDGGVADAGFGVDEIAITGLPTDGAETDPGWTYTGFSRTTGKVTQSYFNAYLAEYRIYTGYDRGLKTGPYNFGFTSTKPNWVEHFPYQDGLLVWYYDTSFPDNNVGDNCAGGRCGGLVLPVDAHPNLLLRPDGQVWRPRVQSYDSTFGLQRTDRITLHQDGVAKRYGGLRANPLFDDTMSYWRAPNASIGNFGLVQRPAAQDGYDDPGRNGEPGRRLHARHREAEGQALAVLTAWWVGPRGWHPPPRGIPTSSRLAESPARACSAGQSSPSFQRGSESHSSCASGPVPRRAARRTRRRRGRVARRARTPRRARPPCVSGRTSRTWTATLPTRAAHCRRVPWAHARHADPPRPEAGTPVPRGARSRPGSHARSMSIVPAHAVHGPRSRTPRRSRRCASPVGSRRRRWPRSARPSRPGVTTDELDRIGHEFLCDHDAYPSTLGYRGYPKSLCTSLNEVICHGIPDDTVLRDGDICNIDITAYHRRCARRHERHLPRRRCRRRGSAARRADPRGDHARRSGR